MIKSMTGFGRFSAVYEEREISVEIRCVNHRYFEFSARLPRSCAYLEDKIKNRVQSEVARGKFEISVIINSTGGEIEIEPNIEAARGYYNAIKKISEQLNMEERISLSSITRFSDVFIVKNSVPDEDEVWSQTAPILEEALKGFLAMRETEGKKLEEDISSRLSTIEDLLDYIEENCENSVEKYRERIYQRIKKVLEEKDIDDNRILLEAAIFADKSAVDEEIVRLKSHISQFREIVGEGGAVGRKLDFLVQEMNREANTIGSKISDAQITVKLVEIKSEIEKIREQIQNIE